MAEPPLIDAIIEGTPRRVELICYVRTRHGLMGRVCWREMINGEIVPITVPVPEALLIDIPGEDYGDVPVIEAETSRGGRVATGHEWRRTG